MSLLCDESGSKDIFEILENFDRDGFVRVCHRRSLCRKAVEFPLCPLRAMPALDTPRFRDFLEGFRTCAGGDLLKIGALIM